MDARAAFQVYLRLLQRVVAARGGDVSRVAAEFVWPGQTAGPGAAVALSPLLTGGSPQSARAPTSARPAGIVPVPAGLARPKS